MGFTAKDAPLKSKRKSRKITKVIAPLSVCFRSIALSLLLFSFVLVVAAAAVELVIKPSLKY